MKRPKLSDVMWGLTLLVEVVALIGVSEYLKSMESSQLTDLHFLFTFDGLVTIGLTVGAAVPVLIMMMFSFRFAAQETCIEKFEKKQTVDTFPAVDMAKSSIRVVSNKLMQMDGKIMFLTEKVDQQPVLKPSVFGVSSILEKNYDKTKSVKQNFYEILLYFTLYNGLQIPINIFDMHIRLYHSSAGRLAQPATIGYTERYRVDLYSDNSILRGGRIYRVGSAELCAFMLAFEAGFYDEAENVMAVFGVDIEYSFFEDGQPKKAVIPSDCIYFVQYIKGVLYIKGLNRKLIDEGLKDKSKLKRVMYKCLNDIFIKHTSPV